jgi:hypothetical protein
MLDPYGSWEWTAYKGSHLEDSHFCSTTAFVDPQLSHNPQDHAMRYQLVLQFRGDTLHDYDQMIAVEERLIEALGDSADVDGHDAGSGETNIFIFTSDPVATFRQARPVLQSMDQLDEVTAAFREVAGEQFTIIWPEGPTWEFTVA